MPTPPQDLAKLSKPELIKFVQEMEGRLAEAMEKFIGLEAELTTVRQEVAAAKVMAARAPAAPSVAVAAGADAAYNAAVDRCAALVGPDSSLYHKLHVLKR